MVEAGEVRLPIPDVLVVKAIDHVLAHNKIGQVHVRIAMEEIWRNQICLLNRRTCVSVANHRQNLATQPAKVLLELCQDGRELKFRVSGSWPCSKCFGFLCTTMSIASS